MKGKDDDGPSEAPRSTAPGNALSRRTVLMGMASATVATGLPAPRTAGGALRGARWDTIVTGAGVFGAWVAWHLQRKGRKVLLLDAWGAAHGRSSSGGETRLIRTEYGGDPLYTRWAMESLLDWRSLSTRCGDAIFRQTGALYIYPRPVPIVDESITLQRELGIPIEKLSVDAMQRRWPQIDLAGIELGVLQPTMGTLMARRGVQMLVREFQEQGGEYRQAAVKPPGPYAAPGERLEGIRGNGETLSAKQYVFACGPWLPGLFPDVIGRRIVPSRQSVFFFAPAAGDTRFGSPECPAWVDMSSKDLHYGFPDLESRGFKIATDVHGPPIDPDAADRRVSAADVSTMRTYLRRRFPDLAHRPLVESRVCQYENTDNGDLLIDRHPHWSNVWIAGGGTGHGFKHGPAVGRHVAGLVDGDGETIERFRIASHQPMAEHDDSRAAATRSRHDDE